MTREEAISCVKQIRFRGYLLGANPFYEQDTEAIEMAIKALSQEPCDDAIDREYLFKVLDDFCGHDRTATITLDTLADLVYDMPPVTQKSGKWINDKDDMPTCSKCGYIPQYDRAIDDYEYSNYCPNCGAKMESEDKE